MVKSTISTDILDDSNTKENIVYNNNMPCCASTFIAVKEGHIKCLSTYRPEDLLRVNKSGQSLLHLATYLGNLKVVNFLIGKVPCLIDSRNEIHETPLLIASYCGHINIINKFLDTSHDVAIQRASHKDKNGTTCLMAAISRNDNETSLFLLKRFGKTIASISNNNGMLPLHVAALNGNIEFIRICTKYDQSMVNCKDNYGYTPLIYSIQSGCFLSVKYLVEKAKSDIRIRTPKGQSCLHASCIIGNIQIVKYFLSLLGNDSILEETNDLANCIHCASFHGNIEVLRILAENFKSKRKKEILSLKDSRGNTPLHLAAINDRTAIAKYLISNDVNTKILNNLKQYPLDIARKRKSTTVYNLIKNYEDKIYGKKNKSFVYSNGEMSTNSLKILTCHNNNNSTSQNETSPSILNENRLLSGNFTISSMYNDDEDKLINHKKNVSINCIKEVRFDTNDDGKHSSTSLCTDNIYPEYYENLYRVRNNMAVSNFLQYPDYQSRTSFDNEALSIIAEIDKVLENA